VGERLFLLWSFAQWKDPLDGTVQVASTDFYDYDLVSGFHNYMAIFNIKSLTWYPIEMRGFSPRTDYPLLMTITRDSYMIVMESQLSMPFRWSRQKGPGSGWYKNRPESILTLDEEKNGYKSKIYRIPLK
jgi:hypothetical protein